MCRGVSHTPFMAGKKHIKRWWCVRCHYFIFAHVRAYAIRPYTCSVEFFVLLGCGLVSYSPTSGRMRYAPTPVRLLSWLNTVNHYHCSIDFWDWLVWWFVSFSPIWGRMRYAPTPVRLISWLNTVNHYTCSIKNNAVLVCVSVPFSLTSGRMRYAPTHVRLLSWPNTMNHYPRSMGIHTKKTAYYVSTTPWQKKNLFH